MADLTFYFDPLCPWSWRTSRWVRNVQQLRELSVDWRFFSLTISNNGDDLRYTAPLRIAAVARTEGGNEAVDRVYKALGEAIHERGQSVREAGAIERVLPEALTTAGLDAGWYERALQDDATLEVVRAETTEAKGRFAAFGVPWLVLGEHDLGFFGPVVDVPPEGQEALALWDHTAWMITRPYLYELKRERS